MDIQYIQHVMSKIEANLLSALGKHPSIFTGITYDVFDPPGGFCFENNCGDKRISEPIIGLKHIIVLRRQLLYYFSSILIYR